MIDGPLQPPEQLPPPEHRSITSADSRDARPDDVRPAGYLLVANDGAGSAERQAVSAVAGQLAADRPTELRWTSEPEQFDSVVAELDGRRLVVAGGDGSIHLALNRLAGPSPVGSGDIGPVGIVPAGTGNDYARNLGLSLDLDQATHAVIHGVPRSMPAVQLPDGQLAANNLHFGLGLVASIRARSFKPVLHRFSYPVATLLEGFTYDGLPLVVAVDGTERYRDTALAGVILLAGPSVGGGQELVSEADERGLDVVMVDAGSPLDRARDALAAVRSRLEDRSDTHHWRGRSVTVAVDGDETAAIRIDVDGEHSTHEVPATFTFRPDVWRVLVPA